MQYTSAFYKSESMKQYAMPVFNIRLYDDYFNYSGKDFGSFKYNGMGSNLYYGTTSDINYYNTKTEKLTAEIGTSTGYAGYIGGANNANNSGSTLWFARQTNGYYETPILTPYYTATWDKVHTYDMLNADIFGSRVIFLRRFEEYRNVGSSCYFSSSSNTKGTITTDGIDCNSWNVSATGIGNNSVYVRDTSIFGTTFAAFGEVSISFRLNGTLGTGDTFYPYYTSVAGVTQDVYIAGSLCKFYRGGVETVIGTVQTGSKYWVTTTWYGSSNLTFYNCWFNEKSTAGTIVGLPPIGTMDYFSFAVLSKADSGSFSADVDNLIIHGTNNHQPTWTGNYSYKNFAPLYYIRTSNDGTNFGDYYCFSGSNGSYDASDKTYPYILNNISGKFAQFKVYFPGRFSDVANGTAWIGSLMPHCYKKVEMDEINDISNIDHKIQNDSKMGLIESSDFTFNLCNYTGSYIGVQESNIFNNPLFYNRPLFTNAPVRVDAGFCGSTGTELAPCFYGYITSTSLSENDISIAVTVTEPWGIYGDLQAGTLTGTHSIGSILQHFCDFNGIPRYRQYIEDVKTNYRNVALINSKPSGYNTSNGGYGDQWDYMSFPLDLKNPNYQMSSIGQTNDGLHAVVSRRNTGWRKFTSASWYQDTLKVDDYNYMQSLGIGIASDGNGFEYLTVNTTSTPPVNDFYMWKSVNGNITNKGAYSIGAGITPIAGHYVRAVIGDNIRYNGNNTALFHILTHYNGTSYMLSYIANTDSINMTYQGSWSLGSANMLGGCYIKQPIANSRGTTAWYTMFSGFVGTTPYIFRYGGGTGVTDCAYIDKIQVPYAYRNLYYNISNNILYLYGNGGMTYNDYTNNVSILDRQQFAENAPKIGLTGMSTQHQHFSAGTVYINGVPYNNAGTTIYQDGTLGKVQFDKLYGLNDNFTISYTVDYFQALAPGTNDTFKTATQNLCNLALGVAYFDNKGNFVFKRKYSYTKEFALSTNGTRIYGTAGFQENTIDGRIYNDINKIKNEISIKGSGTCNGRYIDLLSQSYYGTRKLEEYTNNYITTQADTDIYGTVLLDYLKYPKYYVEQTIPFHPEIEVMDGFDITDTYSGQTTLTDARIKSTSLDLKNFTLKITGETKS
jgi:hypothetical protein